MLPPKHELETEFIQEGLFSNIGDYMRSIIGVVKGDTRSLEYSSHELPFLKLVFQDFSFLLG